MPKIPFFNKHPDSATDPVCKMDVDVSSPNGGTHEHEGETYYFCAPGCRVAFSKEPPKYLNPNFEGIHM
ncbi:MAG: YHS domain-containing protein [Dehalococcoidia bacterium]|nr:YHS domain-containing protein [Dehalococcoidia bacterium]